MLVPPLNGTIIHHENVASRFVPSRLVDVWLPAGIDKKSKESLPVIYMQDGEMMFRYPESLFAGSDYFWDVDKAITRLVKNNEIRPTDIGGIEAEDYVISSDNYLKFLVDELKPFIDKTYPTLTGQADTFIIGSSMGGLISAYAVAEYPEVYGGAACLSLSLIHISEPTRPY